MSSIFKNTLGITLALFLISATAYHKFYVSVTQINYSNKEESLQITSRIFIDDFENVLKERYGVTLDLGTHQEAKTAIIMIERYLNTRFTIHINGKKQELHFLGKEYENDVVKTYIEIKNTPLSSLKSIKVESNILYDLFQEQQNIIHFNINNRKKSFLLMKDKNTDMLKL